MGSIVPTLKPAHLVGFVSMKFICNIGVFFCRRGEIKMKKRTMHVPNLVRFLRYTSIPGVILILLLGSVVVPETPTALAATGDFSIDWVAAEPSSYNHDTGGGAYDVRDIGVDVVESLQGGDFVCGDIVTFLAAVTVDDTQSAIDDEPQTIEMDFSFLMDTTGQSGVAIGDIVLVQVNYAPIEDLIDGEDNIDQGIIDDGGSVATLTAEWTTGPLFTAGSELWGTVELTDLEAGEQVVVRVDTKLFCDPGSDPTGNLQADLQAARLTFIQGDVPVDPPQAISGGAQTIPFQEIALIIFLDFGDLPAEYGLTNFDVDGARHGIGDLFLGSAIDSDSDGQESAEAIGDDTDDQGDDEDGVVRPTGSTWSDGLGEVLATVSGHGCLTAWLDFTDGTDFGYNHFFTDTITLDSTTYDELIIESQLLEPGTTEIEFELPLGAADNYALFYARFRLVPALFDGENYSCGEAPGLTGFWQDGEVEDYAIPFGPTAITLAEFEASSKGGVPTSWLVALALLGIALLGFSITRMRRFRPNESEP
jgi:hypothetical protein